MEESHKPDTAQELKKRRAEIHAYIMKFGGKTSAEADAMIADAMPHLDQKEKQE